MKAIGLLLVAAVLSVATVIAHAQDKTPKVDTRERKQQVRIKEGVKSGELTKRETRRLEAEQAKIRRDEAAAKADGKVTKAERAQLHKELNRSSKHIYNQKHDAQKRK